MVDTKFKQMDNSDLEKFYLKQLVNNVPEFLFWKDKNSVFLGCNKNFSVMAGLADSSEIVGKTDYDLPWSKEESDSYRADDLEVMRSGQGKYNIEESQTTKTGELFTLLTNKIPLYDQNGDISGVIGIYTDITKLKNTQIKLEQEKIRAEAANRAKTEFLANISHDVKTPMTGVVSVADLMMHTSGWCTPDKAAIIHSSGLQVLNFFNSCLELSKLEITEWSSAEEVFSLKTLFEEIYALFLPRAISKGLQFTIEYDTTLPLTLFGHRGSAYRVVLNLVGNALKFTETGSVQLRAFLAESINEKSLRVGIEIKDTGVGIPEDKQQIIFEKLCRLTPSYQGKIEGSGIGLYIVDQYVKYMDGSINVESTVGKGSSFTVLLPMTSASTPSLPENTAKKVFTETNPFSHATPPITAPANFSDSSTDETTLAADAPRILLVEDSDLIQVVTKMLLHEAGFRVDVASSGEEALEMFSAGKYGLIYMDIGLPVMSGYETAHAIRAKEKTEHASRLTPIIALTGHGAVDVQTFCGQAGMQGVLSKPLTREQVENVWKRYGEGESIDIAGLTLIASPSPSSIHSQIIDVDATVTLLGTEQKARDLFAVFAKELTEQCLPNIEKSIQHHNREALGKQLHAMLGTLCYVKVPLLHQAVVDLQFAAQSDFHTIETAYQQLQKEAENFMDLYQKMKNEGEI